MNRKLQLFALAFCIASPCASPGVFAQTESDPSLIPEPWAAPVGHRQPTSSGLAPVTSPDALAPVMSGRSTGKGDVAPADRFPALNAGPRICTNCDD